MINNYTKAGKLIVEYAKKENMTVADLSKKLKISYSHLINMLKGVRDITSDMTKKLCNVLNLDKQQKFQLKEAIFISNKTAEIYLANKKENWSRLIYMLTVKSKMLSDSQIERCIDIVENGYKSKADR